MINLNIKFYNIIKFALFSRIVYINFLIFFSFINIYFRNVIIINIYKRIKS